MRRLMPLGLLLCACAVVKSTRLRADYDAEDRQKVKRLLVLVQPLPDGNQKAGDAWARIARRYVNQKRNFLAQADAARAVAPKLAELCVDNLEGVLWLKPTVAKKAGGFEATVDASLLRCRDGQEVWAASAGGSFGATDEHLKDVTESYAHDYGAEAGPYVATAFNLLRPTLDTLPNPQLTPAEEDEKPGVDE